MLEDLPATAIYIPDLSQRWEKLQSPDSRGSCHWEAASAPSLSRSSCIVTRKNGAHMETLMNRGSKAAREDRVLSEQILITSIMERLWKRQERQAGCGRMELGMDRGNSPSCICLELGKGMLGLLRPLSCHGVRRCQGLSLPHALWEFSIWEFSIVTTSPIPMPIGNGGGGEVLDSECSSHAP